MDFLPNLTVLTFCSFILGLSSAGAEPALSPAPNSPGNDASEERLKKLEGQVHHASISASLRGQFIDKSFSEFLIQFNRLGLVPTRRYTDHSTNQISRAFSNGLNFPAGITVPGADGITSAYQKLICNFNSHICDAQGQASLYQTPPASAERKSDEKLASEPCATKPKRWELCIPILKVRTFPTVLSYRIDATAKNVPASEREDVKTSVLSSGGCASYDEPCRKLVDYLNKETFHQRAGKIISSNQYMRLPSQGYVVTMNVTPSMSNALDETTLLTFSRQITAGKRSIEQTLTKNKIPDARAQVIINTRFHFDTDKIKKQFSPKFGGARYQTEKLRNKSIMTSINYNMKFFDRSFSELTVFYYERGKHFGKHCAFRDKKDPEFNNICNKTVPASSSSNFENFAKHHATQVASIIAGARNGWGSVGVIPGASLIKFEDVAEDPYLNAINTLIRTKKNPLSVNIMNVSADVDYESAFNPKKLLQTSAGNFLIVAAAGNNGDKVTSAKECKWWPACLSNDFVRSTAHQGKVGQRRILENVISVVALDSQGKSLLTTDECPLDGVEDLMVRSNHGPFDVAAPGVYNDVAAIESSDPNLPNALSYMCGSSAAAPLVSSLAAALVAEISEKNLTPTPKWIRARILATADLTPELEGKVRFGRINFQRAIKNFGRDRIRTCGIATPQDVTIQTNRRFDSIDFRITDTQAAIQSETDKVQLIDIRRLERIDCDDADASLGTWPKFHMVYYDKNNFLKKDLVTINPRAKIKFAGSKEGYRISSIADFTPCSFSANCERTN